MKLKELTERKLFLTELCEIGFHFQTDKPGNGYTKVYYEIMKDFQNEPVNLLEIGIYFGASLKMWHKFFTNGNIYGIDNGRMLPGSKILVGGMDGTRINILSQDDVKLLQPGARVDDYPHLAKLEGERIKCYIADQRSKSQLDEAFKHFKCNEFDFIVDDGQHFQEHQQRSLGLLFPNIKPGGYYIIEDVTSQEMLAEDGHFWGQRKKDATDSTDYIFKTYLKTGKLESRYLTSDQIKNITDNIDDIFLFDNLSKNNSPINGSSKLLVIKKKNGSNKDTII